jgi:uncharacterized protein (DUF58 family)
MARAEDNSGRKATTWRFGLTDAGKVILRGIVFIVLAALIIPAFDVLSVLICVMLVGFVVGFVFRPKILITGNLPDRIVAGQTAQVTYTVKNIGRLPAYHLRVRFCGLPEAIEQVADARTLWRLGPGQTAEVVVALRPRRRGCYRLEQLVCESSFPFNLLRFGTSRDGEESLIVLPAFSLLDLSLPYVSRHVNPSSLRPAGRMGTSPEYIGNRPYQPGDPPRRIDVRAWARLSVPATKEYDIELDNRAALVLDTRVAASGRRAAPKESKELEAAVRLCASMAYTVQRDCLIDLLLAGADLHSFVAVPKAMRLDRVHETLAGVEASEGYTAEQIGPLLADQLGEICEIVFIVLHWDRTYQQLAEWAEQAGCHCTVIVVGEPDPSDLGLRISDWGLAPGVESAIRNPQSAIDPIGDVRFVSADEILAGRSALQSTMQAQETRRDLS